MLSVLVRHRLGGGNGNRGAKEGSTGGKVARTYQLELTGGAVEQCVRFKIESPMYTTPSRLHSSLLHRLSGSLGQNASGTRDTGRCCASYLRPQFPPPLLPRQLFGTSPHFYIRSTHNTTNSQKIQEDGFIVRESGEDHITFSKNCSGERNFRVQDRCVLTHKGGINSPDSKRPSLSKQSTPLIVTTLQTSDFV